MSGVDFDNVHIRKGAADVMFRHIETSGNVVSEALIKEVGEDLARRSRSLCGNEEWQGVWCHSLKRHREGGH